MHIVIKRAYEAYVPEDGFRVLVDRLWPRGISKERAHLDLWLKEIAPSTELRTWFGHDPAKWSEFKKRYLKELAHNQEAVQMLKAALRKTKTKTITLVYGARDTEHNEALVLQEFLSKNL